MKQKHIPLHASATTFFSTICKRYLLPALAIGSITACNLAKAKEKAKDMKAVKEVRQTQTETEKVIALPAITRDPTSVHNSLKQKLPHWYALNDTIAVEILADSADLHLKNGYCWIEYRSNVIAHMRRKDGSEKLFPTVMHETTDTVLVK